MRRGQFGEQCGGSVFSLADSEFEMPLGHPDVQGGLESGMELGCHLCAQVWSESWQTLWPERGFLA